LLLLLFEFEVNFEERFIFVYFAVYHGAHQLRVESLAEANLSLRQGGLTILIG